MACFDDSSSNCCNRRAWDMPVWRLAYRPELSDTSETAGSMRRPAGLKSISHFGLSRAAAMDYLQSPCPRWNLALYGSHRLPDS